MTGRGFNPNTKYGRRKMREQALQNIANYSPKEKAVHQKTMAGCYLFIVIAIIIVFFLLYYIAGEEAALKWLR